MAGMRGRVEDVWWMCGGCVLKTGPQCCSCTTPYDAHHVLLYRVLLRDVLLDNTPPPPSYIPPPHTHSKTRVPTTLAHHGLSFPPPHPIVPPTQLVEYTPPTAIPTCNPTPLFLCSPTARGPSQGPSPIVWSMKRTRMSQHHWCMGVRCGPTPPVRLYSIRNRCGHQQLPRFYSSRNRW